MIRCLQKNYWADSECALNAVATAVILTFDHVSPPVSPFISFSPLSLRHGVVVVCFEVIKGESSCHSAYAMWSQGSWLGGSLVSAWCCVASLTCVHDLVCVCFPLFLCLFSCCFGHTRMWWHKAAITCMNPPMNWVPVILVCWVWLVLFLLFGFVFVSFVYVSLLFAWFMMITAQWTMYRSFTSSLLRPQQ